MDHEQAPGDAGAQGEDAAEARGTTPRKRRDHQRWELSYLRGQGKATRAQKEALREHWGRYGLEIPHGSVLALETIFGRRAPRALEIGFGMGEHLLAAAQANPERDHLGVEIHRPGVGAVIKEAAALGLDNLRVLRADALKLLADHLRGAPFEEVFVFFPEPWPRPKDHGRRIVRPLLAELLAARVASGGRLHLATDDAQYAAHMLAVMDSAPGWRNLHGTGALAPRPDWRPLTRYERKGLEAGRAIHDLCFVRQGDAPPEARQTPQTHKSATHSST